MMLKAGLQNCCHLRVLLIRVVGQAKAGEHLEAYSQNLPGSELSMCLDRDEQDFITSLRFVNIVQRSVCLLIPVAKHCGVVLLTALCLETPAKSRAKGLLQTSSACSFSHAVNINCQPTPAGQICRRPG